jgi:tripartite-type tricarboxylate transporter receptor subunit TctC
LRPPESFPRADAALANIVSFTAGLSRWPGVLPMIRFVLALVPLLAPGLALAQKPAAWEPAQPVELVVPAGTGGGADQMARLLAELIAKHQLMKQPLQVVNKAGNSGAEGLLDVRAASGNPHKLIITLSNLFTTPLATGSDFRWTDLTPVKMMARDQFLLWVKADSPARNPRDLMEQLRAAPRGSVRFGGTGTKQEDQIVSVLLETAAATRVNYVPLKGGGDVARALAAGEVDITVNNPIEGEKLWRDGKLRPLCVFDGRPLEYREKVTASTAWADLPTCMSFGIPVQYLMLRGIFTTPGATPAQVAYYADVLEKVRALPEWKRFMAQGAFMNETMTGAPFRAWLERTESFHRVLMREARLLASQQPPATKP